MIAVWIVATVVVLAAVIGLYSWTRRVERDVDFSAMRDDSPQTDDQRRTEQLGIGLSLGQNLGGPL